MDFSLFFEQTTKFLIPVKRPGCNFADKCKGAWSEESRGHPVWLTTLQLCRVRSNEISLLKSQLMSEVTLSCDPANLGIHVNIIQKLISCLTETTRRCNCTDQSIDCI